MWPAAINYKRPEMQKQGYSEISWENLLYVPLAHTESPSPPLNLVGVQMKSKYLWLWSWNWLFHFWAVLMPLPCCFRWTWPKLFEILWSICFSFFKLKWNAQSHTEDNPPTKKKKKKITWKFQNYFVVLWEQGNTIHAKTEARASCTK